MYVKYPLSLRNVEDLLAEPAIDISRETVRWRVAQMPGDPQWRWDLDEAFVKVNSVCRDPDAGRRRCAIGDSGQDANDARRCAR